jgi:hypothetical protein
MRVGAVLFAGALLIVACGWNAATMNPESKEWPCGTRGIVCGGSYPHASCCWQGDTCGGVDPACPEGYCCWVGDDGSELKLGESGSHLRMRPQRP